MFQYLILAGKLWTARPLRAVLAASGIIAGLAGFVIASSISTGAQQKINQSLGEFGVRTIIVESLGDGSNALNLENIRQFRILAGDSLDHSSGTVSRSALVNSNGARLAVKLVFVEPSYFELFSITAVTGRVLLQADKRIPRPVCVVSTGLARELRPVGSMTGKRLGFAEDSCEVIGEYAHRRLAAVDELELAIPNSANSIFLPASLLSPREHTIVFESLILQASSSGILPALADLARAYFDDGRGVIEVKLPYDVIARSVAIEQQVGRALFVLSILLVLVGGAGIMNVMLFSVVQRTREIGLRRAVGAQRLDIANQFIVEGTALAAIAGAMGIVTGIVCSRLITQHYNWLTVVDPNQLLMAMLITVLAGIVFSTYPAIQAARMLPARALAVH